MRGFWTRQMIGAFGVMLLFVAGVCVGEILAEQCYRVIDAGQLCGGYSHAACGECVGGQCLGSVSQYPNSATAAMVGTDFSTIAVEEVPCAVYIECLLPDPCAGNCVAGTLQVGRSEETAERVVGVLFCGGTGT